MSGKEGEKFEKWIDKFLITILIFLSSLLYADIVNFTPLSEQLSSSELVRTLNDLFGRFDELAQVSDKLIDFSDKKQRQEVLFFG